MNNSDNRNDEYEDLKQEVDDYVLKLKRIRTNEEMRISSNEIKEKKEEEITIPISNASFPKLNENINIKIDTKKKKRESNKDIKISSLKLSLLMLLFIPSLFVLFVIGTHSSMLINKFIFLIVTFLLVITTLLFGYGLFNYFKNFKRSTKKLYNKVFRIFAIIFFSLYIIGSSTFLIVLYGPFNNFKDWLVTTAMSTMNHQYLCKWFYSDAEIKEVQSRNYIIESGESTDPSLIGKEDEEEVVYNEYEKQIMIHEKDEKYKIITFEVNGARAFLAAIYDPSMLSVEVTQQVGVIGEYVTHMAERTNAMLAINAGGFIDAGNNLGESPTGITIVDGKIVTNNEYGAAVSTGGIIGMTEDNVLVLLKDKTAEEALEMGVRDAVSWGPFLIVNGVSATVSGNGGWGGGARSAIGQRKDGTILLLVVESNEYRTTGAGMEDLVTIMENYGAYNAANLDGGTSSVMALPKAIAQSQYGAKCADYFNNYACAINDPIDAAHVHRTRYIATSWIVTDK